MRIGFVGTGTMGTPIAGCLIRAGHVLSVFDCRQDATADLCAQGAERAETAFAAAYDSDVVFTSLPGPIEFEAAMLEPQIGILAGIRPGAAHIDLTTNAPKTIARVAEACRARGIELVDAPVSGRPPTMTVMVGASDASFAKYRPLFDAIAANVFHVGPTGAGATAKLVTQYLGYTNFIASLEGMIIAAKAGIDLETLAKIVPVSAGQSRTFDNIPRGVFPGTFAAGAPSISSLRMWISPFNSPETLAPRHSLAHLPPTSTNALRRRVGARRASPSLLVCWKRWPGLICVWEANHER